MTATRAGTEADVLRRGSGQAPPVEVGDNRQVRACRTVVPLAADIAQALHGPKTEERDRAS